MKVNEIMIYIVKIFFYFHVEAVLMRLYCVIRIGMKNN